MSKRDKAQPEHRFLQVLCILLLLALLVAMLALEYKRSDSLIGREGVKAADFTYTDHLAGYVFRSEVAVSDGGRNGVLHYLAQAGATVSAGDVVLEAYGISSEQDERERAAVLYAEIEWLEQALRADGDLTDEQWLDAYQSAYLSMTYAASGGDWQTGMQEAEAFSEILRQVTVVINGGADAIEARIAELYAEVAALVKYAEVQKLHAGIDGRFFREADGYEAYFSLSKCASLTPEGLEQLLGQSNSDARTVGKVVDSGRFYLAVPVTAEVAAGYAEGESYAVRMTRGGACTMLLERISYSAAGDSALLMLCADAMPEGMDHARRQTVEIERRTVSGISLPDTALCFEGDTAFVYVIENGVAVRRSVEVLCREDGCCIVAERREDGWLRVGERVLLRAAEHGVFEGMVLNK